VSSRRAARAIVEACRTGAPSLVIGAQARAAVALQGLAPGIVAAVSALAARFLPPPDRTAGTEGRLGRESASWWAPSRLTRLGDRAAARNNELDPALPIRAHR
jgi:hypothetical protein